MSAPLAMQVAKNIGDKFGATMQKRDDTNAIESILAEAAQTDDPQVMQNTIGKILSAVSPERQGAAIKYIESAYNNVKERQQQSREQAAALELGYNPYAPKEIQKSQFEEKQRQKELDRILGTQKGTPQQSPIGQQNTATGTPQQPQESQQPQGMRAYTDDQLVALSGVKGMSEPAKQELKRRQEERKTNKSSYEPEAEKLEAKRVADLSTQIEKDYTTSKQENIRLDRMQNLSNKDELSTPLMVKALDTVGLPIGILSNPDTEEYRKLETDFIREARDIFPGGRITNYEIQSYLKTIPGLMNSKEGRKAIIRNRKLFNDAKEVRYNEYKKIVSENGGKRPQNMSILLEERTADKIAQIEDTFKAGIEKEIEKFQTPIRMISPDGKILQIPPSQLENAIKAGAKFQ